jgi:hypothetical protein
MIGWSAQHGDLAFVCLLHIALHAPTLQGRTSISTSILNATNRGTWASTGLALLFSLILWSSKAQDRDEIEYHRLH